METLAQLHPQIVHFPIALLLLYVLLEFIGIIFKRDFYSKAAHLVLFLGVLSAVAAVLTGNQAEELAELWEEKGAIIPFGTITDHENFANITLWYFTGLLVLRTFLAIKKKFTGYIKYGILLLAFLGVYFVYQTGIYGGKLVYDYGVGTELKKMEIEE